MAAGGTGFNRRLSAIVRPRGPLYFRRLHTKDTYTVAVTRAAAVIAAPVIVSVAVTSTPQAATSDTYGFGETIQLTATFDKAVVVGTGGGTPRIEIRMGSSGGTAVSKWAQYSSGSDTAALVFNYVVQATDMDDNGIWLRGDMLELQSGTIRDATDTVDAILDYDGDGGQVGHKVDGSLTSANTAPAFSAVAQTRGGLPRTPGRTWTSARRCRRRRTRTATR